VSRPENSAKRLTNTSLRDS